MALTIGNSFCAPGPTKNCDLPSYLRDKVLRPNPEDQAKIAELTPRVVLTGANAAERASISVAGREIAFQAGKLSAKAESRLREAKKRLDRMEASVDASMARGLSMLEIGRGICKAGGL